MQLEERRSFKWLALSTVTTWGCILSGTFYLLFETLIFNYIHIAFSIADVINKVGAATVVYLASKKLLGKRVPEEAVMPGYMIG